jgi:hypothetical protein
MMAEFSLFFFFHHSRKLKKKLVESGAVSVDTAKTIEELGLSNLEIRTLKRLVFARKVKEITDKEGNKRYYMPNG